MIQILNDTTENPLQLIGKIASICWNSEISDKNKNIKRAKSCIASGHSRVEEWVNIDLVISGYSARCIRELMRHIIGTSVLQESTRYVDCSNIGYYNPIDDNSKQSFDIFMHKTFENYGDLISCGVSKENAANILPLGMHSKVVVKFNLRALVHFMNMRLCTRAYKEIRQLANEIKTELSKLDEEWKWICDNLFVPNCEVIGYCIEEHCCGRKPKGLEGLKQKIIEEYRIENNLEDDGK